MLWFTGLRLLLLFCVMGYAAYSDYRIGEVSNRVWLYAPVGLSLTLVDLVLFEPFLFWYGVTCMVFVSTFSLVAFYFVQMLKDKKILFGGNFEGADSKALITLALSFPLGGFLWFYPLTAFMAAGVLVGLMWLFKRKGNVRFLPYLFVGMLLAFV
jgi:hypothetical protein